MENTDVLARVEALERRLEALKRDRRTATTEGPSDPATALLDHARRRGMRIKVVGPEGEGVSEADAATLLGIARKTLSNRWHLDQPIKAHRIGRERWYSFRTLADFIERRDAENA